MAEDFGGSTAFFELLSTDGVMAGTTNSSVNS